VVRRTMTNGKKKRTHLSKDDPLRPLTTKQQRFVDFYDGNATDAARKAGYKGNTLTLGQVGDQNLKKINIVHALRKREDKRNNPHIATREERQAFWTRVLRGEELSSVIIGAGKAQRVEMCGPKMPDRLKASELLGRSEADFIDTTKLTGPNGGPIQTQHVPVDLSDFSDSELTVMEKLGFSKGKDEPSIS